MDERQALVDEFTEDEDIRVFLLSTRAGGMGCVSESPLGGLTLIARIVVSIWLQHALYAYTIRTSIVRSSL